MVQASKDNIYPRDARASSAIEARAGRSKKAAKAGRSLEKIGADQDVYNISRQDEYPNDYPFL